METFWGIEDDMENEQEEIEEKLRNVEKEIVKLKNKNEELKSELNHEIEEKENLKEYFKETKKNGEIVNHKLKKKIEELEAKVDLPRKELTMTTTRIKDNEKFEKRIEMLDEILNRKISSLDNTGLGYDSSLKTTSSTKEKTQLPTKGDEGKSTKSIEELQEDNISSWNRRYKFRKNERPRKSPFVRYENIFLGHCYACRNFGHKAFDYKAYARNNYMRNINDYGYPKDNHANDRSAQGISNKNYISFIPLMDQNIVCYKCNEIGHKARNCRNVEENDSIINKENPTTTWKKEQTSNKEECKLALIVKNKEDEWYIDSGCSAHMTGNQNKYINLKKRKSGSIALGNDSTIKILGKCAVNLGNKQLKVEGVLLIEYLKHNPLSVGKMCDQGYNLRFNSINCKIKEADLRILVATATRNPHNIYILGKVERKKIEALQKRNKDNNKEGELVLSAILRCYNFPLMSKGGREKENENDDKGSMMTGGEQVFPSMTKGEIVERGCH